MSDVKMSDVFELPVSTNDYDYCLTDATGYKTSINCNGMEEEIAEAINSYDANQELIASLQADKELLRKYMLFIAEETDNETLSISGVNSAANKALEETK